MRSPPTPTTRLMKLVLERVLVGREQACWDARGAPHSLTSAPSGGWKTPRSPTLGSVNRSPMRLTSTRWPTSSVGSIDSLGIRYGLTRKAWIPSASPRATTTIITSSRRELDADLALVVTRLLGVGRRLVAGLGLGLRLRGGLLGR